MYIGIGVLLLIVGQALILGREILYLWALGAWLMFTGFLVFYEEPQLRERFGAGYEDYTRRVNRWLPTTSPAPPRRRLGPPDSR